MCSWQRLEPGCSCRLILMPGQLPGHPWKETPVLTSYWLPPQPGVHSVAGQSVQSLL